MERQIDVLDETVHVEQVPSSNIGQSTFPVINADNMATNPSAKVTESPTVHQNIEYAEIAKARASDMRLPISELGNRMLNSDNQSDDNMQLDDDGVQLQDGTVSSIASAI